MGPVGTASQPTSTSTTRARPELAPFRLHPDHRPATIFALAASTSSSRMARPSLSRPARRHSRRHPTCLLSLPDDVLSILFTHVLTPLPLAGRARVVEASYLSGLPLSFTCRRLRALFDASLRHVELWQSGLISSRAITSLARRTGAGIRSLVLRGCARVDTSALKAVAENCRRIVSIDLSGLSVDDEDVDAILVKLKELRELRLRDCKRLTVKTAHAIGRHGRVSSLDLSGVVSLSDSAVASIASGTGPRLRTLVLSGCLLLTDASLSSLASSSTSLRSLTIRGLPDITNTGIDTLCRSLGGTLSTLDVLDCGRLHVESYLDAVRAFCPKISWRVGDAAGRSLKQVVISSLAGFIFYVTGSDICNGKAAVYFLLVDAGTADSFRVSIGSSVRHLFLAPERGASVGRVLTFFALYQQSLDLTNFGSILASCFGDRPSQFVKDTMLVQYGLDLAAEEDEAA